MIPKPLNDLIRELANPFARFVKYYLVKLPFFIAKSTKLMRLITLAGFSVLSAVLLAVMIHIVKVQEAVRSTEENARNTSLNVELVVSRMVGLCTIAEGMLKSNKNFYADLKAGKQVLPLAALLQPPDPPGFAIIVSGEVFNLAGDLDLTAANRQWVSTRWNELSQRIGREMAVKSESTLFLSLERVYRSDVDLSSGAQLAGSLVIARAWRDSSSGWIAVIVLVPLRVCFQILHLRVDDYQTGNYSYLVDGDGYLLAHPNLHSIKGTDDQGRSLRAASNSSEVDHYPINVRDSDWIAGGDMLTRGFSSMIREKPTSVVLRNLVHVNRLTSFHLVDLHKFGVDGYQLGVVSGRGLPPLEGLTATFLLRSPSSLNAVMRACSYVFFCLLSAWLWLVARFRAIHQDLLDLDRYVSFTSADYLGLLPIPNEGAQPHMYANMVGVIMSLDLPNLRRENVAYLLDIIVDLASKLREDGWIVNPWSTRSIAAARHLRISAKSGSPEILWSPSVVANYFGEIERQTGGDKLSRLRVSYGLGDLTIKAIRKGGSRRTSVTISGSCLANALHAEYLLSEQETLAPGMLVSAEEDLREAGLPILGQRLPTNGQGLLLIALHGTSEGKG